METGNIRQNLIDAGCSSKDIEEIIRQLQSGNMKDAYAAMIKDSKYTDNKELMIIPDAVHTDLYDGGGKDAIPFDKIESFYREYLK